MGSALAAPRLLVRPRFEGDGGHSGTLLAGAARLFAFFAGNFSSGI